MLITSPPNIMHNGFLSFKDIDECVSNPCTHGTCRNEENKFRCDCPDGYNGTLCSEGNIIIIMLFLIISVIRII